MILSTIKLRVLAFARCHSHPYSHFTADSPYNSELIIKNALEAYKKRTKRDLLAHPLTSELETCDSPTDILAVLQRQVQGLDQSWSGDEQWIKRLDPTASVLFAFSARLGVCDSLVIYAEVDTRCYAYLRSALLAGILSRKCDFRRDWRSLFSA